MKLCLFLLAGILSSCVRSEFLAEMASDSGAVDWNAVTMEISSPNIADGITETLVQLKFKSKQGLPVADVSTEFQVSGSGNSLVPCSLSDLVGASVCRVISTTAEMKTITCRWGSHEMSREVEFIRPRPSTMLVSIVSGGSVQTHPQGQKIMATSGIPEAPISMKDAVGNRRLRSSHYGTMVDLESM